MNKMKNIFQKTTASDWHKYLLEEFSKDYMQELELFLEEQTQQGKVIYPDTKNIFNAFKTPLEKITVVILGQDPYHGENQAHGLSFSVRSGVKTPPSLKNIYKEIHDDLDLAIPEHGNLEDWAKQGVLLLNAVLTVEAGKAGSHQKKGWEQFTDKVVDILNTQREGVVFLLWGSHAQKKGKSIDNSKHLILKAPHPSPLSVYRGFYGCKHFSQANSYLLKLGKTEIEWALPIKI